MCKIEVLAVMNNQADIKMSAKEIAVILKQSVNTVSKHLRDLSEDGIINKEDFRKPNCGQITKKYWVGIKNGFK